MAHGSTGLTTNGFKRRLTTLVVDFRGRSGTLSPSSLCVVWAKNKRTDLRGPSLVISIVLMFWSCQVTLGSCVEAGFGGPSLCVVWAKNKRTDLRGPSLVISIVLMFWSCQVTLGSCVERDLADLRYVVR